MARLTVRVTPRAGRNAVEGQGEDGVLRVRVTAAPADGKANDAVVRAVARAVGVPPSRVTLVSGAASRVKQLEITGMDEAAVRAALAAAAPSP